MRCTAIDVLTDYVMVQVALPAVDENDNIISWKPERVSGVVSHLTLYSVGMANADVCT